jgi:uncharacterized Zn-finger protein
MPRYVAESAADRSAAPFAHLPTPPPPAYTAPPYHPQTLTGPGLPPATAAPTTYPGSASESPPSPTHGSSSGDHLSSRRKYRCNQCDKSFTTGGHLARHVKMHTGERSHKCPFPGCETACSRQDNLQQQ